MSKADRFFRGLALVAVGVILGFLFAPIKKGIRVTVGSNNTNSELMNQYADADALEDWDDDEWEQAVSSDDTEEE